jgi:hypothetical protein
MLWEAMFPSGRVLLWRSQERGKVGDSCIAHFLDSARAMLNLLSCGTGARYGQRPDQRIMPRFFPPMLPRFQHFPSALPRPDNMYRHSGALLWQNPRPGDPGFRC